MKKKINLEAIVDKNLDMLRTNVNLMKIFFINNGMIRVKINKNVNLTLIKLL